jgi:hypothetical protein
MTQGRVKLQKSRSLVVILMVGSEEHTCHPLVRRQLQLACPALGATHFVGQVKALKADLLDGT